MSKARKISQLPLISNVTGESYIPISVNGVTYRTTPGTIADSGTAGTSANTGNISFDSSGIFGGIYNNQGGPVYISNYSYVTAEAETAWIQIPAGSSGDSLRIVQELGPVSIDASGSQWQFGTNGNIILPSGGDIVGQNGVSVLGEGIADVTYSELTDLINEGQLAPGKQYLITDFATCYDQPDYDKYRNAITTGNYKVGPTRPILVSAISSNQLAADAYQPDYPLDKIKYDWEYSLTYNTGSPAKGRIIERIDQWGNRTDYDHRDVLFKRYRFYYHNAIPLAGSISITGNTVTGTGTNFEVDFVVGDFLVTPGTGEYIFEITDINSATEMIITGITVPNANDLVYHKGFMSTDGANTFGYNSPYQNNIDDPADFEEFPTFFFQTETIVNTRIGNFYTLLNWNEPDFDLPNNVFGEDCINNVIGDAFYNNTFVSDIEECRIGSYCQGNIYSEATGDFDDNVINNFFSFNIILGVFTSNDITNAFSNNYIGSTFYNNRISDIFDNNLIGADFGRNIMAGDIANNKIYQLFENNRIGNNFYDNTFYYQASYNEIGHQFHNNTIGVYAMLGNMSFEKNKVGEYCKGNLFEGYSTYNIIGNNFTDNDLGPDFNGNRVGNDFLINDIGEDFRNNLIGDSFNFNQIGNGFASNNIGNYFNDNVISDNFAFNRIADYFYNNTIATDFGFGGSQAHGNQIGNYFQNNTIGEYFYNNNVRDLFVDNEVGDSFRNNDILVQHLNTINFKENLGNIVSFTYTSNGGAVGTYNAVSGDTNAIGTGASFNVTIESVGPVVMNVVLNSDGQTYAVNDTITILGSLIGGSDGTDDVVITVTDISDPPAVYQVASCTVFKNSDGVNRLSYYDIDDVLTITGITA